MHTWRKPSFLRVLSSSENISHFRNVEEGVGKEVSWHVLLGRAGGVVDVMTCQAYQIRYRSLFFRPLSHRKMTSYPHTHLFHGEHKTLAISGPHIQVLHSKYATGTSYANLSRTEPQHRRATLLYRVPRERATRCVAKSRAYTLCRRRL